VREVKERCLLAQIFLGTRRNSEETRQERSERCKNNEIGDIGAVYVDGADRLHEVPVETGYGQQRRQHRSSRPSIPGTDGHRKQQQESGRDAKTEMLKE